VYVKEHEWPEVGAWVWNHFDEVSGVSFLPHTEHTYRQAPYQEITEQEYLDLVAKMPEFDFVFSEEYDTTSGSQELACVAGTCELVDLGEG
jgi:ribonucleoside-diphosphate reductase alpha chain